MRVSCTVSAASEPANQADGSSPRTAGQADYILHFHMPGTHTVTNDLNVAWVEGKNKVDTRGAIAADELGGKIFACDMTMDIMGIKAADLEQDLIEEYCAVGTYIREARESSVTLFI